MDEYYIYLRKSRADRELEALGQGETLARHEKTLLDLAKRMNLSITKIYREIVSGETISSRPEVIKLLDDIYTPECKGVLVMEIERLARGNTKDQGIIAEAFKYSGTKIITPTKTYDPDNEFDEEYFEFGLFMSRREYKTINRRIQRGRITSANEGKFIGSTAPYGYEKVKIPKGKGYTLHIIEEEAKVVRYIYDLYVYGIETEGGLERLGRYRIAKKLDELGIKPRLRDNWSVSTIKDILTNPVYIGKIRWGYKKENKQLLNDQIRKTRTISDKYTVVDGLHDAIISEELYNTAQEIKEQGHYHVVSNKVLKNPLAGLVRCELCNSVMTRVKGHKHKDIYSLTCPNRYCDNVSTPIYVLEAAILKFMKDWLDEYQSGYQKGLIMVERASQLHVLRDSIHALQKEIEVLKNQLNKTYDLLEQGIYTNDVFLERNQTLSNSISDKEDDLARLKDSYEEQRQQSEFYNHFIPDVENLLKFYDTLPNAQEKNDMLKKVIDHAVYSKSEPAKKNKAASAKFHLSVFPNIPFLH